VRRLSQVLAAIPAVLFPDRCGACDAVCEGPFCPVCADTLVATPAGCPVCGEPGDEALLPLLRPRRCRPCREKAPPFVCARAPYLHGGALCEAIHRLKYDGAEWLARPLATLFDGCEPPRADVVTHIPLHPVRLRARGYDQAALLAVALARRLKLPMRPLLARIRPTRPQVGLDRARRESNVAGAFRASPRSSALRVCLVDDVLTTGATAAEAVAALHAAGAADVQLWVFARTP
jgi:ComF family protein